MKRPIFANVEDFSLSPLLAILPVRGDIRKIESLSSSIFARHERVTKLQGEAVEELDAGSRRRFELEAAMLKQVLEWLSLTPGSDRSSTEREGR